MILNDNCLVRLSNSDSDITKVLRMILRDGMANINIKLRDHAIIHHRYNSLFLYKPIGHLNYECRHNDECVR